MEFLISPVILTAQKKAKHILEMPGLGKFFKYLRGSLEHLATKKFHGTPCIWYEIIQNGINQIGCQVQ